MRIGSWQVVRELGRGAVGTVFEAHPEADPGRRVAVKLLRPADPSGLTRFEREARLLSLLGEQEGFVPLLSLGLSEQGPFIVMPLIPGGTLRDRLASGAIEPASAVELVERLARAAGAAHARGVVHRDLKPENVLFTGDGQPLIADLGLAKHFRSDLPGASRSVVSTAGGFKGTLAYAPPEQLESAGSVGPPADVYALGAILYECLAGAPAYEGAHWLELMARISRGDHVPLAVRRAGTPPGLAAVVERCLSVDPARRFPDGQALAQALERPAPRRAPRRVRWVAGAGLLAGASLALAVFPWSPREERRASQPAAVASAPGSRRELERDRAARDAHQEALRTWRSSWRARGRVIQRFEQAIEAAAHDPERQDQVRLDLSRFLLLRGLLAEAADAARPLSAGHGRLAGEATLIVGTALIWQGYWAEGFQALGKALQPPDTLPALKAQAWFRATPGPEAAEGERLARRALELDPQDFEAALLAAQCAGCAGDRPRAILELDRLAEREPDHTGVWMARMLLLDLTGDQAGSDDAARRVCDLVEPSPQGFVWLTRAMYRVVHLSTDGVMLALQDLQRCAALDKDDVRPRLYLAVFDQLLGEPGADAALAGLRAERPEEVQRLLDNLPPSMVNAARQLGPAGGRKR